MPLITQVLKVENLEYEAIRVLLDRHTLSHRRWRTTAEDGLDLAADLTTPCANDDALWIEGNKVYRVSQAPEPVIEIALPNTLSAAAQLGWFLGNQHLPAEIGASWVRLEANDQLADLLGRRGIDFEWKQAVFSPPPHSFSHVHGPHSHHGHHHPHSH